VEKKTNVSRTLNYSKLGEPAPWPAREELAPSSEAEESPDKE
jgi:hypothetical protein